MAPMIACIAKAHATRAGLAAIPKREMGVRLQAVLPDVTP